METKEYFEKENVFFESLRLPLAKRSFFENLPSIVFKTLSVPLTGDRNLPYP